MVKVAKKIFRYSSCIIIAFLVVNGASLASSFIPTGSTTYEGTVKDTLGNTIDQARVQFYEDFVLKKTVYTTSGNYNFDYQTERLKFYLIRVSKHGFTTEEKLVLGFPRPGAESVIANFVLTDIKPPGTPTLITDFSNPDHCKQYNKSSIDISWTEVTDPDLLKYRIYRNGNYLISASSGISSFRDTSLTPFETYTYQVLAVDLLGNVGAKSNAVTIKIGIQWWAYEDNSGDQAIIPENPADWSDRYQQWLDEWQFAYAKEGCFEGSLIAVTFQPRSYTSGAEYNNLEFFINVHTETGVGAEYIRPYWNWPQPITHDYFGLYDFPTPMAIDRVEITTTMLPETDGKSSLSDSNVIDIVEGCTYSFLGNYYGDKYELENLVSNGKFDYDWGWYKYSNDDDNVIAFEDNPYHRYGLGDYLRLYNVDGGSSRVGVYDYRQHDIDDYEFKVNFMGKRISSDSGTTVGVDIKVSFKDGTYIWLIPEEMRIIESDNTWRNYQYSYISETKMIDHIKIYCLNYEKGQAFFDNLYVSAGEWEIEKIGNWLEGTYEDTFEDWYTEMESAVAFNEKLGNAAECIGLVQQVIGLGEGQIYSFLSDGLTIGGYFLEALERPYINPSNFECKGSIDGMASTTVPFDHKDGQYASDKYGYVLACDDTLYGSYKMVRDEFIYQCATIRISVVVDFRYIGNTQDTTFPSAYHTIRTMTFDFEIPFSRSVWWNELEQN